MSEEVTKIREDIATLKTDVKYIKKVIDKISIHDCKNIEKIDTNRKMLYFLGMSLIGVISYLTGIKLL